MMIVNVGVRMLGTVLRLAAWVAALTWAWIWFLGGIALCLIGSGRVGMGAVRVGLAPISRMLAAGAGRRGRQAATMLPGLATVWPAQPN